MLLDNDLYNGEWRPSIVAICYECKQEKTVCKGAHGKLMRQVNWIRMNDDLLERSTVFVEEDGNVIVSAAHYKTLMGEAGWKLR